MSDVTGSDSPAKVHMIGMAGSGKTTFARWAAAEFGVLGHELDYVVYDDRGERAEPEIVERIERIREQPGWVTEGAYRNAWLHPLLDDAHRIVWLDPPLRACLYRMFKRHVTAELRRENRFPGWRRLYRFVKDTREIAPRVHAETVPLLRPYASKVLRCRSSADLREARAELITALLPGG